jgi:polysaccharide chain length determinant protein (PEP-CTERM system associated)
MAAPQSTVTITRRPPDIEDYIDMLRRYRSWLIGPMFAGLVVAVVAAFMWPDTYVSTAMMRITPQQVSERLVPTVMVMQMSQRLSSMQQEILSRGSLTELIQRPALDLYRKERVRLPMEDVVNDMRPKIKIQMIDVGNGQGRATSAFTISFSYPDRFKAQAVVRELVGKFMEQNATVQRNAADTTATLIDDELKQAREKMDALDATISKFKNENMGRLPEQFQANVAQLQSLQMMVGNANEAVSRLQQQKLGLETQLQNNTTNMNYYSSMADESVLVGPNGQTVRNEKLNNLNQKIMNLQSDLAAAKEQFTANHPTIRELQARLTTMEAQYEEEQKKDLDRQSILANSNQPQVQKRSNPQTQRMVQDYQAAIATIKTEIQNTNLQMDEKIKQVQELNRQIAHYQGRIEGGPQLEQQYVAMMRDYGLAKQNYEDNSRKSALTKTSKNMEDHKAGENLEMLDPPSDPTAPTEPNRWQWAAMGTGMGLMLGVVLAGAKEMKNTSLKNLKDVRAYTNLPVLSSIPLLENALLVRRKRRLLWLAWTVAIIVGSVAMSGSIYYYYYGQPGRS